MKKIVILLFMMLMLVGCGKKTTKEEVSPTVYGDQQTGLVISYRKSQNDDPNSIYYEVNLYNTKEITAGYSHQDGFSKISLTTSQYEDILALAFNDKILNLKSKDVNNIQKADNTYEQITLYYDNKVFTLSGYNIEDEDFIKLKELLLVYK